ncbi:fluoroacetyl-CoA thioesterase [Nonomuraea polychroma]|uniref:Fluoroacetyl-CoA thioesterase n=1 Tax=Nonomuraea polychroma TaxID=46176 RepID=A0A438M8F0_9ACTN|nr:thioesterase family protein [Nonomuraea polychroma]RVX42000.1 fluoroacetyl-CoA thioesterase [Nonomuraea polychroma]
MTVKPGMSATVEWVVEERHCTRRGHHDIFSTPNMVHLLEDAAIEAIAPHLEEGQSSVGSKVDVVHSAPTLKGQRVRATATVTEVDRRRVAFTIVVEDDVERIGAGTHERFVIDVAKFEARLASKGAAA